MAAVGKEGIKVYLPLARVRKLREYARRSRRTVTSVVDQAVEEFLKENGSAASSPEKRSRAATRKEA